MASLENPDKFSAEDYLVPPKYDLLGVVMSIISAFIASVLSGTIIFIFSYLSIGKFSLDAGVSPILLAMITFFGLVIGNVVYYTLLSKIFPNIYTRSRTALAQVVIMSIILYIFFAPVYLIVSNLSLDTSVVLIAFAIHILINTLSFQLVIGMTTQYRYTLLSLYSSIISFLFAAILLAFAYMSFSSSSNALFLLLGLVIVAQTSGAVASNGVFLAYYSLYKTMGIDPVGSIFSRIEQEEKDFEAQISEKLTRFH